MIARLCTLHQMLDSKGHPKARGSEVRLPTGEVIPWVTGVTTKAVAGEDYWETTITLRTRFGEDIHPETPAIGPFVPMFRDEKADGMGPQD